ncbi:transcriptional repressor NrdR [Candidatus Daviesbacteria bacterium]|nr:transcriptional repressor NrdR [Candidatus Daviesbacteria bacterium]
MKCFFCGSDQSSVIDKRAVRGTGEIRRRRECLKCQKRYTTYERLSAFDLYILKRDGRREVFDREKLKAGLQRALEKRPALEDLENIVDRVIKRLKTRGKKEIESKIVGSLALSELKKADSVAYLRFASVYRKFNDPLDFTKELESLGNGSPPPVGGSRG